MSHRHVLAVAALAAASVASQSLAQGATCAKPMPVALGENAFANLDTFTAQLSQSANGFGEAYIHRAGWFAFTPVTTGQYVIGVCGASVDTKMALGIDCPLGPDLSWDVLGYNDDSCAFAGGSGLWASRLYPGNPGRSLNAALQAGQTYLIAVGGFGASTAPAEGSLSIELVPPPVDTCATPPDAVIGANAVTMYSTAPTLTTECGGILYDISRTSYLRFTAPYSGEFVAHSCAQSTDTVMAVLTACGDGLSSIGCNDDSCGAASSVAFSALAGETLHIAVGLYSSTALPPDTITVTVEEAAPPVDPCVSIPSLATGANTISLDSTFPNLDLLTDPVTTVYKVNYFSFTAPSAGVYRVSNCGDSFFDSILLRAGVCNTAKSVRDANDDGCGIIGGPSRMQFFAEAGETHIFGIGAWSAVEPLPPSTVIDVALTIPAADACAEANIIDGSSGQATVPMSIAYRALDLAGYCDPGPAGDDAIACARFVRFTATRSGSHVVGTCGDLDPAGTGAVDSRLAVLRNCSDASSVLACDDDGCTGGAAPYTSRLSFQAIAGETYYIAVGGFDSTIAGPLHVDIIEPSLPGDIDGDGRINGNDLALVLGNWLGTGVGDANGDGLVDGSDLAVVLNGWTG